MILKFKRVFTVRRGAFDFYVRLSGKLFEPEQKFVDNFTKNEVRAIFLKIVVSLLVQMRAEASSLDYAECSQTWAKPTFAIAAATSPYTKKALARYREGV